MKLKNTILSLSVVATSILAIANSAQAATFKTNFTPDNPDPEKDILLKSVEQNGQKISNFSFVNKAKILLQTPDDKNGPSSTDHGDQASKPVARQEKPSDVNVAKYLGNNNLNNIMDTEDNGGFIMDVFFDSLIKQDNSGLDNLFFWERGMNSDLRVQALDKDGNLIGNALKLLRITKNGSDQVAAGFSLDTKEIGNAQEVGSWGVSLAQLGVTELKGLKLSGENNFDGPDFKVVARKSGVRTTPEPGAMMGLGALATLAFLRRNRLKQRTAN